MAHTAEYDEDMFDAVIGVNVKGVFLGLRMYCRSCCSRSAVLSSTPLGRRVGCDARDAGYVASKHAVIGLTKTAAARSPPRCAGQCGLPGPVDTRMIHSLEAQLNPPTRRASATATVGDPDGPLRQPGRNANTVLFLCSDLASAITGAQYVIDGGRTATGGAVTQRCRADRGGSPSLAALPSVVSDPSRTGTSSDRGCRPAAYWIAPNSPCVSPSMPSEK